MGSKADAYLALEPLALQGHLELLDHRQLVRELSLLERVYHPGGRVTVDHPRGQHDDHANALALAVLSAWRRRRREADEESMRPEGSPFRLTHPGVWKSCGRFVKRLSHGSEQHPAWTNCSVWSVRRKAHED